MPDTDTNAAPREVATLAGGCFWCLEAVYDEVIGVDSVESGYIGGAKPRPTYYEVCSGRTGHAEAVQITFDPAAVTFRELLEIFFVIHDPTTLNRQGNDAGTQYRSGIYYHSEAQKATAEGIIAELTADKAFPNRVVTEVMPAGPFFIAEPEHQEYYARNPEAGYCQFVVAPKVGKFRKTFAAKRKVAGAVSY